MTPFRLLTALLFLAAATATAGSYGLGSSYGIDGSSEEDSETVAPTSAPTYLAPLVQLGSTSLRKQMDPKIDTKTRSEREGLLRSIFDRC